jgi:excinuclease ABC subunit A
MPDHTHIHIRGARQHNLKDVHLSIPRDCLVVFTGVSGSGKSSLAFDTIFAEGQRRYVESLSAYARQFLGQLDKPDVDYIEGLSPAISIDQKSTSHNPRSTVGTVTEIYDYLRLLFGRAGTPHCYICDRNIAPQTIDQMVDAILALPERSRFQILAPVVRGKKGTHRKLLTGLIAEGFARVRVDGEVLDLNDNLELDKNKTHDIEVVVDRLVLKEGLQERLTDSLRTCLKRADGIAMLEILHSEWPSQILTFSENFACPEHGAVMDEMSPRLFSFNSPYGACPACHGIGSVQTFTPELVIPDPSLPVYAAIAPWTDKSHSYYLSLLVSLGEYGGFEIGTPWEKLSLSQQDSVLYGTQEPILIQADSRFSGKKGYYKRFEGILEILQQQYAEGSDTQKQRLEPFMTHLPCKTCQGTRLRPESLAVRVGGYRITDFTGVAIAECLERLNHLSLDRRTAQIADQVLKELRLRLQFLLDVGLDYLTLNRPTMTLSGGEAQRIRLATQIGSGLTGVLYVLDEPSIGLHQRDNQRLLTTLCRLRDLGNTLIVVEHDEDTIRAADYLVDIGPGAGVHGGAIVAQGTVQDLEQNPNSVTGAYLARRHFVPTPNARREGNGRVLELRNAHRNNLKNINVTIPLGMLVCVTGVSGSGKSTLINELLHGYLQHHFHRNVPRPEGIDDILGLKALDKFIVIDQSPIGRTPRSNPATYSGVFDIIRETFALTTAAKTRGYKAGQFSFNVKGGRCEACGGQGVNVISMNFLPDVYVQCDVCKGARYNRETLEVKYRDRNISEVLNMTIEEAMGFFENIAQIHNKLAMLVDVGLGYVRLGQPAPTLSGGEAQRLKLAAELARRATGKTLYLIDEPTTGLSFYDVHKLLEVVQRLVDKGNSVLMIEHNLDVIRCADWVIDLGPEGGDRGGEVLACGTPETLAAVPHSHTGRYLQQVLSEFPAVGDAEVLGHNGT